MAELTKLQIRAKVLDVVSKIKTLGDRREDFLLYLFEEIKDIDDKKCVFDILVKEYIKMDDDAAVFTACIIKEFIDAEYVEEKSFEILKSPSYSDEAKYKIVQLLRIMGSQFDYKDAPMYFDSPDKMIDSDTKKLLEKAVFNPEAMLDFLDFVSAVPDNDRFILLKSLKEDYAGDSLANIVYPILYSDFDDKFKIAAAELLTEAKSSLAIGPFNYVIETSSNPELVSACKVGLKKLKLAGASLEKANDYYLNIIKDTVPFVFYTTIPDGNGNQALLMSRVNDETDRYMFSAVVINDIHGVIDCFGFFNISNDELKKIINKFYQTDGKYKVSPEYVKTRLNDAANITIVNKNKFPYEYICWEVIMKDIMPFNTCILSQIEDNIDKVSPSKDDILTLLTKDYSFRWYIKPSENKELANLLDEIYNKENILIEDVNSLIKSMEFKVFDEKTSQIWKNRLIQCIYLLKLNSKDEDASIFYSIISNEDNMHTFRMVILQRSVFNYFYGKKENSKELLKTTNIFRKKQIEKEQVDENKVNLIVDLLAKSWLNE